MSERLVGKASYFTVTITGQPVNIPITKADMEVDQKKADTTDNGDYVPNKDLLGRRSSR